MEGSFELGGRPTPPGTDWKKIKIKITDKSQSS